MPPAEKHAHTGASVGVTAVAIAACGLALEPSAWWVGTHTDQGIKITDFESIAALVGAAVLFVLFTIARNRVGKRVAAAFVVASVAIVVKSLAEGAFGYTFLSAELLAVLGLPLAILGALLSVSAAIAWWPDRSLRRRLVGGVLLSLALTFLTLLFFVLPYFSAGSLPYTAH